MLLSMTMIKSRFIAIAMCLLANSAIGAGQPEENLEDLLATAKAWGSFQCDRYRQLALEAVTEFDKNEARHATPMACECVPKAIERAGAIAGSDSKDGKVSRDAFLAQLQAEINGCASAQMRAEVESSCERDDKPVPGVTDRTAYCACFKEGVRALSDAQLVESAQETHDNFNAKVKARANGESPPQDKPTALDQVHFACRGAPARADAAQFGR